MRVYKFGGASVKSALAILNLGDILSKRPPGATIVVVSAMGKTTNSLEALVRMWFDRDPECHNHLKTIIKFHKSIAHELFGSDKEILDHWSGEMSQILNCIPPSNFDEAYDSVVSFGELLSTTLVSAYLESIGLTHRLLDARQLIITDDRHREANTDFNASNIAIRNKLQSEIKNNEGLVLTQGFIGGTSTGKPTTLGREGSDYSAAIFAGILDAQELVIWKDVPGLLNADPKFFSDTKLIPSISYREAIELAYYGASIIHPKTIKPLQNKQIPLRIKSFIDPESSGSLISSDMDADCMIPSFILKQNQVLLTLSPRDFSFMDEKILSSLLQTFAEEHIKLNLMQNSAISFSVCFDYDDFRLESVLKRLTHKYITKYNTGVQMITIRHYNEKVIAELLEGKSVLLEQRSRLTAQFIAKTD